MNEKSLSNDIAEFLATAAARLRTRAAAIDDEVLRQRLLWWAKSMEDAHRTPTTRLH